MTTSDESLPNDELPKFWSTVHGILRCVVAESDREAFFGDLLEEWSTMVRPRMGPRRADWWLLRQALGSAPAMLRRRLEREGSMIRKTTIRAWFCCRLSDEELDSRVAWWVCVAGGAAMMPLSIVALVRHPGGRPELMVGIVLAAVTSLLILMLGLICRYKITRLGSVPLKRRWPEFASYVGCLGLLIGCIRALPSLELTPVAITVALLAICALSLSLLVAGMMTTVCRAPKQQE